MSEDVYLLPLKYTQTCQLQVIDTIVKFEPKTVYKFSDHDIHRIINNHHAKLILVTIDTNQNDYNNI